MALIKKLLSLFIALPAISTGIYYGTKKPNGLIPSPKETNSSDSQRETDSLVKKVSEDFPKYCRVLLNSRDLKHEVLLCFDLDKNNYLNKTYKSSGQYFPTFFLLNKTHSDSTFSMQKINGLFSTLKKNKDDLSRYGSQFMTHELWETTWQAFRRKKDIFNTPEIIEKVGHPFYVKYRLGYPKPSENEFLFPMNSTEFMWRKYFDFDDGRAVLREEDLITGAAFSKKHLWGDGLNWEMRENIRPLFSDPHDPRLIDLKNNSKYQIILNKSDKYWNAGGANNFDDLPKTEFFSHKSFVCSPSQDLFEGKILLNCSE